VRLPQDVPARQKLAAAHDYSKVRAWAETVRLLQALLDAPADSFRREPYRDKHGKSAERWTSIRAEAERLLANLPKEGKDFYLLTYEPKARAALDAARARRDPAALQEVARRYRRTRAGTEALEQLGSYHLDRGQTELAAACFAGLLRDPGADQLAPLTLFKAALAGRASRTKGEHRDEAWKKLVQRMGEEGLRIGSNTYDVAKLRKILESWPAASADDYPLYRGDPARSAQGRGDFFLLEPQWRIATAEGEARQWVAQAARAARTVLPAATPIALDGKLIYRGSDGLRALDARTGRPLWHRPSSLALDSILGNAGQKVQVKNWLHVSGPAAAALVENTTIGTLSGEGRRVYAVEDLPLPPPPELLQNDAGLPVSFGLGPMRHFVGYNCLRALDPNTGKLVWEAGGPSGRNPKSEIRNPKSDGPLRDAYFLGPPLPLGGQVFALVEKQQELRLVCLDGERGTVRWAQMLATAPNRMLLDVVRHTQAAHLAYADGVLVCPTNSGAILGVDPLSRSLLWVHVYAKPPTVRMEGAPEATSARSSGGWKDCAPIVHRGRIVVAPPDDDGLYCLHLRDGSPVWKATRGEEDLYVGCVHRDTVLVVGKTSCRALNLETGEVLWRKATGSPAGQGIAAGSIYYLPLKGGSILALNLDTPGESVRLEARGAKADLGNLVFHGGTLWSQSATELTALTPLTTQLARLEDRLRRAPGDPSLLYERGRLHLDRGDLTAAAADLHDALTHNPPAALRVSVRDRLFAALTQLLQRDFPAAEKYLDEYRALCRPSIPASAGPQQRAALEKEGQRRQTQLLALIARGREKQGRVLDALEAYRELSRHSGELMTVPDEPAVQTRPDLWAQGRVAALLAHANPSQRQLLEQQVRREGQKLSANSDRTALRRFVTLFGAIEGEAGSLVGEARLRLARHLAHTSGRHHALEAELMLHEILDPQTNAQSAISVAQALYEHAALLTQHGLLEEAVTDYRQLAREHPGVLVHDGESGAQLLDELRTDKRFLTHLEPIADPWKGRQLRPTLSPRGLAVHPLRLPCLPCRTTPDYEGGSGENAGPPSGSVSEAPPWCRRLRFQLDGSRLQLRVLDAAMGTELYGVPLPLVSVPPYLRDGEVYYQAVDHLIIVSVGPVLLGVDLFERRVRWSRQVVSGLSAPGVWLAPSPDGGFHLGNDREVGRLGLIGPAGRSAVCVQTRQGLLALDPASGEERWRRSDAPRDLAVFGDGEYLFLVDRPAEVRAVRAVRARDGLSVTIPDAAASYANRLRILGRHLLVAETGPRQTTNLRLYDPLTGKDVRRMSARAGSFLLHSPQPHWLGVVEPDGNVTVVDLARREEVAHLRLDPRDLRKVRDGHLLTDRERFYVALRGPIDPELKIQDEPSANFRGLAAVPVNGPLYAFDRESGERKWSSRLPPQWLLLEQFEQLPVLVCSAFFIRGNATNDKSVPITATRSLDKRTGKVLYNREVVQVNDLFHALRIDPDSGVLDLLSATQRLRHAPEGRK
jgi:outer membrane protein assembly factor BamB